MSRPEYEFFSLYRKIDYFFNSNKIDFTLESTILDPEFVVKRHTIIKGQNNLNIFLKKGNNLIISNLSDSKITAEEDTNIFIYNNFTGTIDSDSLVSLGLGSKIKGNISCKKIMVSSPFFNKKNKPQFDGKLEMGKSS
jgi:cytoskeletal protein CcmA (bactofilin family)